MLEKIYSIFYSYVLCGNYFCNKCARTDMRSPSSFPTCAAGYMHRKTMAARRIYCPQYNLYAGICAAQCMYSAPYRCARIPAAAHIFAHTYAFLRQRRILYEGARTRRTRRLFFIFLHFLQKYFLIKKSGRIKKFRPKFLQKIPKKIPAKKCGNFFVL